MFYLIVELGIVLEHQGLESFDSFWVANYLFNLLYLFLSHESNRARFIRLLSIRILALSWVNAGSFIRFLFDLSAVLSASDRGWRRLMRLSIAHLIHVKHLLGFLKPFVTFIV